MKAIQTRTLTMFEAVRLLFQLPLIWLEMVTFHPELE